MSLYMRSGAPGQAPAPAIPDRVALTNERLYPRSRLLGLAKQHLIATNLKSAQIVQALLKKREEGDSQPKGRVMRVANRIRETTRTLSSAVVRTPKSPPSGSSAGPDTSSFNIRPASPCNSKEPNETVASHCAAKDTKSDDSSRGRSPVRPRHLQYTRRYSVCLRGTTPSPTRFEDQYQSSKQWRASKRPATPPPMRQKSQRGANPSQSVTLVRPVLDDEDPLPLEGRGWTNFDSPITQSYLFEPSGGFDTGSPLDPFLYRSSNA